MQSPYTSVWAEMAPPMGEEGMPVGKDSPLRRHGPIAEPKKGSFIMGEHLSPDKRGEILRMLQGTVRFLKANEAQKRSVRMKMESKVRNLLEIKHMTRQKFQEELEGDFRRIFDTNYGLSKQIKTFLERNWTQ